MRRGWGTSGPVRHPRLRHKTQKEERVQGNPAPALHCSTGRLRPGYGRKVTLIEPLVPFDP